MDFFTALNCVSTTVTMVGVGVLVFRDFTRQAGKVLTLGVDKIPAIGHETWKIVRKVDKSWVRVGERPEGHPDLQLALDHKDLALVQPDGTFVRGAE